MYTTKEVLKYPKTRSTLERRTEPYWCQIVRGVALGYNSNGGSWTVRKYHQGQYYREYLGISDDIEGGLSFSEASKKAIKFLPQKRSPTVAQAWENYLAHLKLHGKDLNTPTIYYNRHIRPTLGELELARVTLPVLEKWLQSLISRLKNDEMRVRQDTANRIVTVLKAILNKAFKDGLIDSDLAWRRLERFKGVGRSRIRVLSDEEIQAVLKVSHSSFRKLFLAALFTGCRYSELSRLEKSDFDGRGITVKISKTKQSRYIPLNKEGIEFFTKYSLPLRTERGHRWANNTDKKYLAWIKKNTGITFRLHALRHTFATRLLNNGAHPSVVAKLLGHTSTKMVEKHYGHLYEETLRSNIEQYLGRIQNAER